jgi:hypothetical protein
LFSLNPKGVRGQELGAVESEHRLQEWELQYNTKCILEVRVKNVESTTIKKKRARTYL